MKPFVTSIESAQLIAQHPGLDKVLGVLKNAHLPEIDGLCRLWISEGVPYCFSDNPMLYEIVRDWIARKLEIHPKELSMVGSGRIGYSLAPLPKLGRAFGAHSDLDLVAVSADLFDRYGDEVARFRNLFKAGEIVPRTERERLLWEEILEDLNRTGNCRGFYDAWKVPTRKQFPLSQSIVQVCWELREKLRATNQKYCVKHASLRVYRDFSSFMRQVRINLRSIP